jgi:hypothetical protein
MCVYYCSTYCKAVREGGVGDGGHECVCLLLTCHKAVRVEACGLGSNPGEKGKNTGFYYSAQSMRITLIVITVLIVVPFFVFFVPLKRT